MRKEIALEPLVGHLRHPYGLKECVAEIEQVCHNFCLIVGRLACCECTMLMTQLMSSGEALVSKLNSSGMRARHNQDYQIAGAQCSGPKLHLCCPMGCC